MPNKAQLTVDVVSDVVCPWCYIGKRRLETALAQIDDVDVTVRWRPFFLNAWIPREGIDRDAYLTAKFGSVDQYKGIAGRVKDAAASEGLVYDSDRISRQPNTTDSHRLILWAERIGQSGAMKQRLMSLYFTEGADLTNPDVLAQAAADCGLDANEVRAKLASEDDVDVISAAAASASNAGISGVPTFILANKYAISGAQPPEQLVQAIRQVAAMADEEVLQG